MSKAILIIDMPKGCGMCKLRFYNGCNAIAENNYSGREITGSRQVRKKWCPLKPMPSREDIHEEIYQAYGLGKEEPYIRMRDAVDKVLDEMLGEEE